MTAIIEWIHESSFNEFAALLMLAATAGLLVSTVLRQPLIIAFIAVGIFAGSSALDIVESGESIGLLAELGIAILLFIVGLKLDLHLIRNLGSAVFVIGIAQVLMTAIFSFGLCLLLGIELITALYISVALSFSSTIIVVKILSDNKQIDLLHGQVALGILIIQDFAVILAMMFVSTLGHVSGEENVSLVKETARIIGYTFTLGVFVSGFSRYFADSLSSKMARSPELLIVFSMAWAFMLAAICDYIGLGKELGGLLAGISLASTRFRDAIVSRLVSIRDFLLLFFFISLGVQLDLSLIGTQIFPAIILSAFVLLFKPLIIVSAAGLIGFRKRTGFLSGVSLAQISEFSFIFMAMAYTADAVSEEAMGLVTLVGLITIALSAYGIAFSDPLYRFFEPFLAAFERDKNKEVDTGDKLKNTSFDVIIFGYGRYGQALCAELEKRHKKILLVDFDPDIIEKSLKDGREALYGDANDPEFYKNLPLSKTRWVISAMPRQHGGLTHDDSRIFMIEGLKNYKYKGGIAVASHNRDDEKALLKKGADIVFHPFQEAAERAVKSLYSKKK